jgi:tetratricopeptide (TPR) repeat protein
MLKFIYFFFIVLISCGAVRAQTAGAPDAFEVQSRVYKAALKNYDIPTATSALYNMQALKPERTDLNDSLALLYFAGERYAQAYLIGEEIVKNDPKRKDMLELVAVSKQNLGLIKESLSDYEKLYAIDKSIFYLYQMATEQYQLKRYGECVASLDQIIANPESEKQKVNIRVQGGGQEVVMKAAAYNVRGICASDMGQKDAAKENFTKAIEIAPDFALAKGNLEALDKKDDEKSTTTKPATTTKSPASTRPTAH